MAEKVLTEAKFLLIMPNTGIYIQRNFIIKLLLADCASMVNPYLIWERDRRIAEKFIRIRCKMDGNGYF